MTGGEIVGALSVLLAYLAAEKHRQTAGVRAANRALCDAVTMTEAVVGGREARRTEEVEGQLTNAWHHASLAFSEIGEERLSRLCLVKGYYWMDPSNWTDKQIDEAGIRLRSMRRELNRRLQES